MTRKTGPYLFQETPSRGATDCSLESPTPPHSLLASEITRMKTAVATMRSEPEVSAPLLWVAATDVS